VQRFAHARTLLGALAKANRGLPLAAEGQARLWPPALA
jgi:hypothetical protein